MLIIPANSASAAGGFEVSNSCRFNGTSSDYLSKTPSSSGNRKTWTASVWLKGQPSTTVNNIAGQAVYSAGNAATDRTHFYFTNGIFEFRTEISNTQQIITTNQTFSDPAAFYHFVVAVDSTQSTAANRVKIYVNGVQITSFAAAAYLAQNADTYVNHTVLQTVGRASYIANQASGSYWNGYMAEFVLLDGTAATPTSFGEFDEDSNIWKPIDVSGLTAGTNGFYLDFKATANLGNDAFGGTDLDEYNLTAIDQSTDTCTNNFATLNPLAPMDTGSLVQALSEGNLKANGPAEGVGWQTAYATIPLSSGKWYIEVLVTQVAGNEVVIGLNPDNFSNTSDTAHSNSTAGVWYQSNGNKWVSGSSSSYGATYDDGDIISVLINMDDSEVTFYKNDASQGTISFNTNLTGASSIIFGTNGIEVTSITQFNFGSPPYAVSSSNTDGNGYGNFEFATKGGYALNTKNLAEYG